jgi:hypothetical protein
MKQAVIFGKAGCSKCTVLKSKVSKLLEEDPFKSAYTIVYYDILKEAGMVEFCKMEVINAQQIPALVIYGADRLPIKYTGKLNLPSACGDIQLRGKLGIQTDYDDGNGVLTSEVVKEVMIKGLE